jgi:hypothetical protein
MVLLLSFVHSCPSLPCISLLLFRSRGLLLLPTVRLLPRLETVCHAPNMADGHIERLQTGDLELGATEAVQRHVTRTVVQPAPVTQRKLDFEHSRPRWLRECMAEATGVFFYGTSWSSSDVSPPLTYSNSLSRHRSNRVFHFEQSGSSIRLVISSGLGLRYWYRFCHHYLRADIWRPL